MPSCRRRRADRIIIPGSSDRTKVRWNKRHLAHMAHVIPITPEIQAILEELRKVGGQHGDAETWLFPSGHIFRSGECCSAKSITASLRGLRHQWSARLI